jgi:hypothetical protein
MESLFGRLTKRSVRRVMYILAITLALGLMSGGTTVFAVHDATPPPQLFELDGNAVDNPVGLPDDWDTVLLGTGGGSDTTTGLVLDPTGANETTHFKGGDKDTQDIPAWDIVTQNDTPKDDIEHAAAAAYTKNGHLIIYAMDDRFAQAGSASHGFWFFKNPITISGAKFSGVHADGDTLVTVEFAQGGATAIINVFEWVTNPGPHQPNLQLIESGATNVTPGQPFCNLDDTVCGITNSVTATSPWDYISSSAGAGVTDENFPPQSFFEMGIDITELTGPPVRTAQRSRTSLHLTHSRCAAWRLVRHALGPRLWWEGPSSKPRSSSPLRQPGQGLSIMLPLRRFRIRL